MAKFKLIVPSTGHETKKLSRQEVLERVRSRLKAHRPGGFRIKPRFGKTFGWPRPLANAINRLDTVLQNNRVGETAVVKAVRTGMTLRVKKVEGVEVMAVVPREAWGARPPKWVSHMGTPQKRVFVHHTVSSPSGLSFEEKCQFMRDTQNYHMDGRGWSDIAYNFVVFQDGTIFEGRGWGRVGGHTSGYNSTSHAVCAAGNYEVASPNDELVDAIAGCINIGKAKGAVSGDPTISGHRDVGQTACPGAKLYNQLGAIRGQV